MTLKIIYAALMLFIVGIEIWNVWEAARLRTLDKNVKECEDELEMAIRKYKADQKARR